MDYYEKHYNIKIKEDQQPLLISLPKERDKRRGQSKPILLVPELCVLTGTPYSSFLKEKIFSILFEKYN